MTRIIASDGCLCMVLNLQSRLKSDNVTDVPQYVYIYIHIWLHAKIEIGREISLLHQQKHSWLWINEDQTVDDFSIDLWMKRASFHSSIDCMTGEDDKILFFYNHYQLHTR